MLHRLPLIAMFVPFIIVAAALVTCSVADPDTDTVSTVADGELSFKGRIVLFAVDESSAVESKQRSVSLVDPIITRVGERYFVTGRSFAPKETDSVFKDVEAAIAWERVQMYYAFTPEQFEKYVEYWRQNPGDD